MAKGWGPAIQGELERRRGKPFALDELEEMRVSMERSCNRPFTLEELGLRVGVGEDEKDIYDY